MKPTRRAALVFLDEKTKRLYIHMDDEMKRRQPRKREDYRAGRRVFYFIYLYMYSHILVVYLAKRGPNANVSLVFIQI